MTDTDPGPGPDRGDTPTGRDDVPGGSAAQAPTEVPPREIPRFWRRLALGVVAIRFAIPLAAIPFFPWLLINNVSLLILLRPQKEFLLVGGGQNRYLGEPALLTLFLAFLPLGLLSVPAFFVVGRAYGSRLRDGTAPDWVTRAVRPHHVELGQRMLARKGPRIAILGRFAALPYTMLAAAAGVSDVSWRAYLAADAVGAVLATAVTIGVGYSLGRAYQDGDIWLTVAGVVLFGLLILLLTQWMRREANRPDAPTPEDPQPEDPQPDPA